MVGYSRAVVSGANVHVSGTAPIPREGDPPGEAYEQARGSASQIIGGALGEAGAGFEDVVRTRIYLTDADDYEQIARAHGEVFGEIRPASTAVVVKSLLDPRWRVEIEADAVLAVKQIYPNSITGKGAVAGGSVLDHKFGQSDPYTLGVEEEYCSSTARRSTSSSTSTRCCRRSRATSSSPGSTPSHAVGPRRSQRPCAALQATSSASC